MSESKINIKVGTIEFSGEGNQDWLAAQLDKIFDKIPELVKVDVSDKTHSTEENSTSPQPKSIGGLSVLNIAGKLGVKSGTDLVIVAAAYLHFVEGKASFSRDDISTAMKKATGIYKDTHMSNLSTSLSALEKSSTLLKSGSMYSLNATKVGELSTILSK